MQTTVLYMPSWSRKTAKRKMRRLRKFIVAAFYFVDTIIHTKGELLNKSYLIRWGLIPLSLRVKFCLRMNAMKIKVNPGIHHSWNLNYFNCKGWSYFCWDTGCYSCITSTLFPTPEIDFTILWCLFRLMVYYQSFRMYLYFGYYKISEFHFLVRSW